MLAGLGVYFLNFLAGKTKNGKLAQTWFMTHKTLLEENFHVVGKREEKTRMLVGFVSRLATPNWQERCIFWCKPTWWHFFFFFFWSGKKRPSEKHSKFSCCMKHLEMKTNVKVQMMFLEGFFLSLGGGRRGGGPHRDTRDRPSRRVTFCAAPCSCKAPQKTKMAPGGRELQEWQFWNCSTAVFLSGPQIRGKQTEKHNLQFVFPLKRMLFCSCVCFFQELCVSLRFNFRTHS